MMRRPTPFLVGSLLAGSTFAQAARIQEGVPLRGLTPSEAATAGDSPLLPLARFYGRVDVEVAVNPSGGSYGTGGYLTVSGVPAGSDILQAWLLVTSFDYQPGRSVAARFEGVKVGEKLADVEDPSTILFCSLFRFDVTKQVSGNGTYIFGARGHNNAYGDALVVVYEHPSLPEQTIAINDGAEGLWYGTSSTVFPAMPKGSGELHVFTVADDRASGGTEEIRLNGLSVAGPGEVFDANQGPAASLIEIPINTVRGTNVVDVVTEDDFFGLHLAVLRVDGLTDLRPRDVGGIGSLPTAVVGPFFLHGVAAATHQALHRLGLVGQMR